MDLRGPPRGQWRKRCSQDQGQLLPVGAAMGHQGQVFLCWSHSVLFPWFTLARITSSFLWKSSICLVHLLPPFSFFLSSCLYPLPSPPLITFPPWSRPHFLPLRSFFSVSPSILPSSKCLSKAHLHQQKPTIRRSEFGVGAAHFGIKMRMKTCLCYSEIL